MALKFYRRLKKNKQHNKYHLLYFVPSDHAIREPKASDFLLLNVQQEQQDAGYSGLTTTTTRRQTHTVGLQEHLATEKISHYSKSKLLFNY